ncbi:MAG: TlpA family protein disulfide reductase [Blastocatellia bacterium]|nr:TlpA family protein disulfide reductase [Blastocatellia bacterium]
MKELRELGMLGVMLILGICTFTGCGSSTQTKAVSPEKPATVSEIKRGTTVGQIAPDFDLEKTDGTKISFKDLEGSPSVLVFWTAWCPVCKEEAPKINKLAAEFEAKGVKVVGINIGESEARIAEGIKDFGIKYAVAKDKDTSVAKNYKIIGTPTVVFLDKKGAVQYFGNELPKDYATRLNTALTN